jgi:hypothetical protein
MSALSFRAKVQPAETGEAGAWASLAVPKEISAKLPTRSIVPISGTIQGFAFRTSLMPDGKGGHSMMVNKEMRRGADVGPGDEVTVVFAVDPTGREPDVPKDLSAALAASEKAMAMWDRITPRARGEWVEHVEGAKKEQTRARRIEKVIERLAAGVRRVYD